MFTWAEDRPLGAAVWLVSGQSNTDEDYGAHIRCIDAFAGYVSDHRPAVAVQVVEGGPPPPASWRKRLAEASTQLPPSVLFVLVTPSALIRGALTAVEWLRPSPFEIRTCDRFDEAVELVSQRRAVLRALLPALLAQAQQQARPRPGAWR